MATRKRNLAEGTAPEALAEPTGGWIETLLADALELEGRWQAVNEATAARIGTFHKALVKANRAPVAQRGQRARDLAQAALGDRDLADLWPPIRRALHMAGPAPEPAPEPAPAPRKKTLFFEGAERGLMTLTAIPLALIKPGNNPRKTFDEAQLADLAESIRAHGQQVPALVRQVDGGFELVAGERRKRACELAGVPTLLCRLVELDDRAALEVALVENSARADVHPLEEADALAQLIEMGSDVEDLRGRLNRSEQWVRDRLALRTLHPALREAFKAGLMTLRAAVVLAHLPEERQAGIGQQQNGGLGYREALRLARQESPPLVSLLFNLNDATLGGRGACVTCVYRTDKQPDLLSPDGGAVRCTDGACADKKTKRWVEIEEAGGTKVIRGEARDVYELNAPSYRVRRALGLAEDDQRPLCEMVPDVRRTIHVPSWGGPRLLATAEDIAAAMRARGQEAAALIMCPPAERKAAPARQKRAKAPAVAQALADLFDKVAANPGVVDMATICDMLLQKASYTDTNSMLKRRGLDRPPAGTGSTNEQVRAILNGVTAGEQVSMVLELLLAGHMGFLLSERHIHAKSPIVVWMERMGVAIPENMVAHQ